MNYDTYLTETARQQKADAWAAARDEQSIKEALARKEQEFKERIYRDAEKIKATSSAYIGSPVGAINFAKAIEPVPLSEIEQAIGSLGHHSTNLDMLVDELFAKLSGVLIPTPPKQPQLAGSTGYASPVACRLGSVATGLGDTADRIRCLLQSIAL